MPTGCPVQGWCSAWSVPSSLLPCRETSVGQRAVTGVGVGSPSAPVPLEKVGEGGKTGKAEGDDSQVVFNHRARRERKLKVSRSGDRAFPPSSWCPCGSHGRSQAPGVQDREGPRWPSCVLLPGPGGLGGEHATPSPLCEAAAPLQAGAGQAQWRKPPLAKRLLPPGFILKLQAPWPMCHLGAPLHLPLVLKWKSHLEFSPRLWSELEMGVQNS